jgi:tRNA (guanine-N7-)-methyltransferase
MARKLPQVVSEYDLCLGELPSGAGGAILWEQVFGAELPLRIEIGVGNSAFLIEVCRRSPGYNYLGFEYSRKRVLKFLRKVEAAGVRNIRMLQLNAAPVLDHLFAPGSVDHFYINHPDPWPKRRHAKNRLVAPGTVETMCRLLRPGGGMSLRTDAPAYAAQMVEVLEGCVRLENLAGTGAFAHAPREPFQTPYELKLLRDGRRIYYLEYRRREEP